MDVLGIAVIGAFDVLLPAVFATWMIVLNVRRHRTQQSELAFWLLAVLALAFPVVAGVNGILGIPVYEGGQVIPTTLFSLPGSIVPMIATVGLSGAFFDDASWASTGYFVVMPLYLAGTVVWQLFVIVAIRRLSQYARRRPVALPPPVHA